MSVGLYAWDTRRAKAEERQTKDSVRLRQESTETSLSDLLLQGIWNVPFRRSLNLSYKTQPNGVVDTFCYDHCVSAYV
jgi:hypothetical protein